MKRSQRNTKIRDLAVNNNNRTVRFSKDIEMDEMSEKFLNKFGVRDLGDIMENGNDGNEFLGRITSCNKVSKIKYSYISLIIIDDNN